MSICSSFLSIIPSVFGVLCHGLSIKSVEGGQSANIIQDLIFPQLLPPLAFWLNMRDNELISFPFQLLIVLGKVAETVFSWINDLFDLFVFVL